MSLVKKAKEKAKEEKKAQIKKEQNVEVMVKKLNDDLEVITKKVITGLKEFHDVECRYGTLKFARVKSGPHIGVLSLLPLDVKYGQKIDVLYVSAKIESGVRDYSDEYHAEYTEAAVTVSSGSARNLSMFSLRPFQEYVTLYITEVSLERIADWLSGLF